MQAIIDSLQAELTRLRGSGGASAGACEDEPMMDMPHAKKTRLEGGQLAPGLGCWEGEGLQWRALLLGCAEREEPG